MKLYRLDFWNGYTYEDSIKWTEIIAAETEEEAKIIGQTILNNEDFKDDEDASYRVEDLSKIDGYKVVLISE